jgi:TonB family protein
VPVAPTKPAAPVKPAVPVKPVPTAKAPTTPPKTILDSLVPTVRGPDKAAKDRAEAQAREAAREAARQQAAANRATENRLNSTLAGLKAGYEKGSAVDFHGPGGEAYANWDATVQAIYRDAMRGVSDFSDQDFLIVVEVTVARSGRVIESRIVRRSGSVVMDKATQSALDRVKSRGLPAFPDEARESERKFSIDFNLKARRATG